MRDAIRICIHRVRNAIRTGDDVRGSSSGEGDGSGLTGDQRSGLPKRSESASWSDESEFERGRSANKGAIETRRTVLTTGGPGECNPGQ